MKTYRLKHRQFIKQPLAQVFSFFERPENLEEITPKNLGFKILTPSPIHMKAGALIDYVIRIMGIPLHWTTEITSYDPPKQFVDVQKKGPYALWNHTHTFEETKDGTWIEDEVEYALPLGPLGRIAHFLWVRRQLNFIFDYRAQIINKIFDRTEGGPMKIVLAGGTGFIGKKLIQSLSQKKHNVTLLTRNESKFRGHLDVQVVTWDGQSQGEWAKEIGQADAVINLSGDSVAEGRWTETKKKRIIKSRIESTRALVQAIKGSPKPPPVFVNASAVGFYGNVESGDVTEEQKKGSGFLADVCEMWEQEAHAAEASGTRVVLLRIGVVLGQGGGALKKMVPPFKMFAGGPLGSGKQWFPWVHIEDILGMIEFALQNKNVSGPINATAPNPLTMRDFCKELGKSLGRPSWAPVPGFVLKIGLGEMAEMLLEGQKAIPQKLLQAGYQFKYPEAGPALNSILKN